MILLPDSKNLKSPMLAWPDIFRKFSDLKVLIIGDVMVDAYIWGVVERISPEAPVPVVTVKKRDFRLGGAGNVALNLQSLGAHPILCALAGNDDHGKRLFQMLEERNIATGGIVLSAHRPTTVKTRVIAAHQHVVRVDDESDKVASKEEENEISDEAGTQDSGCGRAGKALRSISTRGTSRAA